MIDQQAANQAHRDYAASSAQSAHPVEVVHMLYQIAIDNVNLAIAHLKDGDIFARGKAVNKAHEAVSELLLSLDHSVGASFTRTMAELYDYIQRQLTRGHSMRSERAFCDALGILKTLSSAWAEVKEKTCSTSDAAGVFAEPEPAARREEAARNDSSDPYSAYRSETAFDSGDSRETRESQNWSC